MLVSVCKWDCCMLVSVVLHCTLNHDLWALSYQSLCFGPSANILFPWHYIWHWVNDLPVPMLFKLESVDSYFGSKLWSSKWYFRSAKGKNPNNMFRNYSKAHNCVHCSLLFNNLKFYTFLHCFLNSHTDSNSQKFCTCAHRRNWGSWDVRKQAVCK